LDRLQRTSGNVIAGMSRYGHYIWLRGFCANVATGATRVDGKLFLRGPLAAPATAWRYPINRSYSAWVPIQNQSTPPIMSMPNAR
jgi:hypothetical protein